MAIDKSRTKPWMKGVIIFICVAFFFGVAAIPLSSLLSGAGTAASPTGTQTGSGNTSATVDAIAKTYSADIKALETSASPDDPVVNLAIAEKYFEWADTVLRTVAQAGGNTQAAQQQGFSLSAPYWSAASAAYAKSFKVKSGDASSTTDYAISVFYGGDAAGAVKIAEGLVARDPKFAPVRFNLGIFYANAGDTVKAKAAFNEYLKMDPNGPSAAAAKDMLSNLK
jgi:Flp pilus assembly protein TadD